MTQLSSSKDSDGLAIAFPRRFSGRNEKGNISDGRASHQNDRANDRQFSRFLKSRNDPDLGVGRPTDLTFLKSRLQFGYFMSFSDAIEIRRDRLAGGDRATVSTARFHLRETVDAKKAAAKDGDNFLLFPFPPAIFPPPHAPILPSPVANPRNNSSYNQKYPDEVRQDVAIVGSRAPAQRIRNLI